MKLNFTEAMQMISELQILIAMLSSPDARWDGVQMWLGNHPRWRAKLGRYVRMKPELAIADLKAYIKVKTGLPQAIIDAAITPEIEAQAKGAIVKLQTLYKERQAQDRAPREIEA